MATVAVECDYWAGMSRLVWRLTTILPAMPLAEALETTRIHRVAGLTSDRTALVTTRPFRAPHHTIADAGQIGGGHVPLPGEVSLAHHGVVSADRVHGFERLKALGHIWWGRFPPLSWDIRWRNI